MNESERWTIHESDGTAAHVTALRGRGMALTALVLVLVVLVFAGPSRQGIAEPAKTPAPTFSRNDSGTALPTEAEIWGAIWSRAQGGAVLRPTWLPSSRDEYQVITAGASGGGFFDYDVSYYERRPSSSPGTTVWSIEFVGALAPGRGVQQFGSLPETLTIRGHAAELYGNGFPGWTLAWSEGPYRYAITGFAVSRGDLLRIANSLAPLIDDTGRTNP